jgi:addiction module HigA family antidote
MVRIPSDRSPTHPGEMLLEEFLKPLGLTQRDLADAIHVPYQRVNEIINGRRGITTSTALRLARYFGNSPGFWMNLQLRYDLYETEQDERNEINKIQTLKIKNASI